MFLGLPTALHSLISLILWNSTPSPSTITPSLTFHLRHHHATANDSRILFSDIDSTASFAQEETLFSIPTTTGKVYKPRSIEAFHTARRNPRQGFTPALDWDDWDIASPDLSKKDTVLSLAKMSLNAYAADNATGDWYDISDTYKNSPYGWEPEAVGMRGHVFVSTDNSTVVISIKGTSAGWMVGGGGPTVGQDKKNDNLMFSCCCARVGPTWSTVCDCFDGGYRCDRQCLHDALREEGLFYPTGLVSTLLLNMYIVINYSKQQNLYNNVSYLYPNANIWMTGHSLGGGLASLVGITFGVPVVAFEAPAERMAAQRLHLPSPVS